MPKSTKNKAAILKEFSNYYEKIDEKDRLFVESGPLELARTQEILERHLLRPPAVIYDVGGGSGVYSCWLAQRGYEVHFVDPVKRHVEQARRASQAQPDHPLASIALGDARKLDRPGASVDVVLLFGPLYHLTEREDRIAALKEASRVTRAGGRIFAAFISRFASLLDGLFRGFLDDPAFVSIVERDLRDGQHRNPTENPAYFMSAFFHHPEDIAAEIKESGLILEKLLPVESLGGLLHNLEADWKDEERRERLLKFLRLVENEPSLLGVSAHLIGIAKNQER
jgi:ubiquinone/menaquinone biosynthesis C-methylase UbiE